MLAAAIAAGGPAFAKTVNITSFSPGSTDVKITFDSFGGDLSLQRVTNLDAPENGSYSVVAGQLTGFLDGASFNTYCAEALAPIQFGDPNRPLEGPDYSQVPAPPQFGPKRTADLSRLLTGAASFVTDAATSAAFQAAVWEIIYENQSPHTTPRYDLTDGSFLAEAVNPGNAAAFAGINDVLANLGSYGKAFRVEVLVNDSLQDYLLITSVPEPGSYALLAAGLGVIGFVAGKRRRSGG